MGKTRRQTCPNGDLRPAETIVMNMIKRAAELGLPAPTADQIQEAVGCESSSTPTALVKYLERDGLITVDRYQRERRITITATGKATASVKNPAVHWRNRPRPSSLPSIAPSYVQQRKPELARQIIVAANRERLSVSDMLLELIWTGWQVRECSIQDDGGEGK